MKKLRHPNIILFMGAVASQERLCIVTEFLPRYALHLLHILLLVITFPFAFFAKEGLGHYIIYYMSYDLIQ